MADNPSDPLVAIGLVVKPRGVRGELKVEPLTDFPERFESLKTVKLEFGNGGVISFEIERVRFSGESVLLKLKGVDDRDAAERFRGAYCCVKRSETFRLDSGDYYVFEIEGLKAIDVGGSPIGTVKKVERYPANDVLVIETADGDVMLPAVRDFVLDVDLDLGTMTIDLPEGLPKIPGDS